MPQNLARDSGSLSFAPRAQGAPPRVRKWPFRLAPHCSAQFSVQVNPGTGSTSGRNLPCAKPELHTSPKVRPARTRILVFWILLDPEVPWQPTIQGLPEACRVSQSEKLDDLLGRDINGLLWCFQLQVHRVPFQQSVYIRLRCGAQMLSAGLGWRFVLLYADNPADFFGGPAETLGLLVVERNVQSEGHLLTTTQNVDGIQNIDSLI